MLAKWVYFYLNIFPKDLRKVSYDISFPAFTKRLLIIPSHSPSMTHHLHQGLHKAALEFNFDKKASS